MKWVMRALTRLRNYDFSVYLQRYLQGEDMLIHYINMPIFYLRLSWSTWSAGRTGELGCWKQCPRWASVPRWWMQWTASRSQTLSPSLFNPEKNPQLLSLLNSSYSDQNENDIFLLWTSDSHYLGPSSGSWDDALSFDRCCSFFWHIYPNIQHKQRHCVCSNVLDLLSLLCYFTLTHFWEGPNPYSCLLVPCSMFDFAAMIVV